MCLTGHFWVFNSVRVGVERICTFPFLQNACLPLPVGLSRSIRLCTSLHSCIYTETEEIPGSKGNETWCSWALYANSALRRTHKNALNKLKWAWGQISGGKCGQELCVRSAGDGRKLEAWRNGWIGTLPPAAVPGTHLASATLEQWVHSG